MSDDGGTLAPGTDAEHPYVMTVDLSVLESLGINLYSNAAAVLSELVANAHDADSNRVEIAWKNNDDRVVVRDDGTGMTVKELNERFLKVGYKKRSEEGTLSPVFERPFMGRKGIGKLSVFSIARKVTVNSTKDGKSHGLVIDVADLEEAIDKGEPYFPAPVEVPPEYAKKGTTIVLDELKRKRADLTAVALRKRLARRFDVLDDKSPEEGGFVIEINGKRITWADRQELKKLEFLWEFGEETLPADTLPPDITRFVIENTLTRVGTDWRVRGWFGTAKKPTDLTDDKDAGSLKNIIVLARKRPIQEGIIEKLDFSRLFGNYVTGQIEADFLDLDDGYDDIATSDRQRLIEDDERVVALQEYLRAAFVRAADEWSEARPRKEGKDVLGRYPNVRKWVDGRPDWQRPAAERMIGTIASLEMETKNEPRDRADLFRSGILAFERVGLRKVADELEQLSKVTARDLLPLLGQQDAYEAGLWVDILRSRVEAIEQFRHLTDEDEKEAVLQNHLFNHLWLLDPSWERATGSPVMEENLRNVAPGLFAMDAVQNEIAGRIDIRYATTGGKHVIVELKRYCRAVDVDELAAQGLKYYGALHSILDQQQRGGEHIEVVFVVGARPRTTTIGTFPSEDAYIENQFRPMNGRYKTYDALIASANNQYEAYLEASERARELDALLGTYGTAFSEPPEGADGEAPTARPLTPR